MNRRRHCAGRLKKRDYEGRRYGPSTSGRTRRYLGLTYIAPEILDRRVIEEAADKTLGEAVAEVAGENPLAYVERVVTEGPAAQALVEAAEDADLLVVGSRGHGGFTGLLLGSVSQQCAHHAPCAVVIVRKPREENPSKH